MLTSADWHNTRFRASRSCGCKVSNGLLVATSKVLTIMTTPLYKQVRQLAVASSLTLIAASSALAQQSSTVSADATATIITPIAIAKTSDLVFGKLAVGGTGGTVAVGTNDAVTIAGASHTISQPAQSTGNPAAAVFAVTGEGAFTYSITLPADGAVTLSDGASHTMAVNSFVSNPSGTGALTAGAQTLKVGATLTVGNNQTPGNYTGSFSVTVAYN
jgi:Domain of unknown function (DUF4402)